MKHVITRTEICKIVGISKTHLLRKLEAKNIRPIEATQYSTKKLYKVTDIEQAFNVKINTPESIKKSIEEVKPVDDNDLIGQIEEILKQ